MMNFISKLVFDGYKADLACELLKLTALASNNQRSSIYSVSLIA
jgi:hypothetical protein